MGKTYIHCSVSCYINTVLKKKLKQIIKHSFPPKPLLSTCFLIRGLDFRETSMNYSDERLLQSVSFSFPAGEPSTPLVNLVMIHM